MKTPVLLQRDGSSVHKAKLKLPKNALPTKHLLEAMRISVCHAQMRQCCCHGCEVFKKKNSTWRWIHLQKTSTWYIFWGGVAGFDMKVLRVFIIIDLKLYPLSSLSLKHCQKSVGLQLNFPPNFYNITWLLQKPLVEKGWMFLHDFSYICNMFLRFSVFVFIVFFTLQVCMGQVLRALSLGNSLSSIASDPEQKSTQILPSPTCLCKTSRDHLVKLSGTNLLSETSYGHLIVY